MSNNEHPITPPPELVQQWYQDGPEHELDLCEYVATQAARWGYEQRGAVNEAELQKARDEELDACCQWVGDGRRENLSKVLALRAARRPKPPSLKPPSLKKQALADLDSMQIEPCVINGVNLNASLQAKYQNIRRALEALPE